MQTQTPKNVVTILKQAENIKYKLTTESLQVNTCLHSDAESVVMIENDY